MKSIEKNKIAAILLLMMLLMGISQATPPAWPLVEETEHEIFIVGEYPKVGEIFEVAYRVRLKPNIEPEFGRRNFYVRFGTGSYGSADVIGADEVCIPSLVPGVWQEVHGKYRIPKPYKMVRINTYLGTAKGHNYRMVGGSMTLVLIDSTTGQFGTGADRLEKMANVFWKYDHLSAQWLNVPDPRWEESNRKISEETKKFEPALTDSEALCLHQDNYLLIINAIGDSTASDSDRIEHMLKDGWLKAERSGAETKEKWLNEFMAKNQRRWGGSPKINFFRDNNTNNSGPSNSNYNFETGTTTTFIGVSSHKNV